MIDGFLGGWEQQLHYTKATTPFGDVPEPEVAQLALETCHPNIEIHYRNERCIADRTEHALW
eukprot:5693054-Amphidinium_carterae.1